MRYMLDTDICSYILKFKPLSILEKIESVNVSNVCMSVITYSELLFGAVKSQSKKVNLDVINEFVSVIEVLDFDKNAAKKYSYLRSYLEENGTMIGNNDLLIASHAQSVKCCVVTNNVKHFNKVPEIRVENWYGGL